jgi:glycosyltransferase involved in cell wall biosynthesis
MATKIKKRSGLVSFGNKMIEVITINPSYSTTRTVTRQQPVIEKQAEDKFETVLFLPEGEARQGEGGLRTQGYFKVSLEGKPLITVVTVIFNGEQFIEEAIQSVINQKYDNIEYIIVDGGSTDNTVNIIKKYEDKIDYWVSEADEGQSDAFNKAFSVCQGVLVSWLNADDILLPGAITEVAQTLLKKPSTNWIAGNILWMTEDKKIILARKGENWNSQLAKYGILNVYGPTTFFTLDLFNKVGKLHKWMHYRMDTELWWRFVEAGACYERLENYTWALRVHKGAKTTGSYFDDSELSDTNHPSQIQMKKEDEHISKNHIHKSIFGRLLINIIRLTTPRYLLSMIDSFKNKGKKYTMVLKGSAYR